LLVFLAPGAAAKPLINKHSRNRSNVRLELWSRQLKIVVSDVVSTISDSNLYTASGLQSHWMLEHRTMTSRDRANSRVYTCGCRDLL